MQILWMILSAIYVIGALWMFLYLWFDEETEDYCRSHGNETAVRIRIIIVAIFWPLTPLLNFIFGDMEEDD